MEEELRKEAISITFLMVSRTLLVILHPDQNFIGKSSSNTFLISLKIVI